MNALLLMTFGTVVLALLVFGLVALVLSRRYVKAGSDEALIVSGGKNRVQNSDGSWETVGFRVVTDGGTLVKPIIERCDVLSLAPFDVNLNTERMRSADGKLVDVDGTARARVARDESSIRAAAERLLNHTKEERAAVAGQVLEGHLRSVTGQLTGDQVSGDRDAVDQRVRKSAESDMTRMGLETLSLSIRDVRVREKGE